MLLCTVRMDPNAFPQLKKAAVPVPLGLLSVKVSLSIVSGASGLGA